eukprot:scaffold72912_cov53-Phaeocystis_antarctica.AAC.1
MAHFSLNLRRHRRRVPRRTSRALSGSLGLSCASADCKYDPPASPDRAYGARVQSTSRLEENRRKH